MPDTSFNRPTLPFSARPIRAAIVGTGYIADFHARAIRDTDGVELVCACDPDIKRAQSFANTWSIPLASESLDAMLRDTKIDCVHILTPPDLHFSLAKAALHSGVHVFLEKPMCTSVRRGGRTNRCRQ